MTVQIDVLFYIYIPRLLGCRFPVNPSKRRIWEKAIRRDNWHAKSWHRICGKHFEEDSYVVRGMRRVLKGDALPTIFTISNTHETRTSHMDRDDESGSETTETDECIIESDFSETEEYMGFDITPTEHHELHVTPTVTQKHIETGTQTDLTMEDISWLLGNGNENVSLRRKLNTERTRSSRLRKRLLANDSLLMEMKERFSSETILHQSLKDMFHCNDVDLLQNEITNRSRPGPARRYSPGVKKFASTVFFHSPSAYRYLRQFLTLPNEVTIRKWLMKVDSSPGFTSTSLTIIKERIENEEIEAECVLICDSMAIRKQVIYDSRQGRHHGYVDFGDGEEDPRMAGEALVFLVSGLKQKWRYPIAYFLVGELLTWYLFFVMLCRQRENGSIDR